MIPTPSLTTSPNVEPRPRSAGGSWHSTVRTLRSGLSLFRSPRRTAAASSNSIALALLNSLREPLAFVVRDGDELFLTGGNPALERLLSRTAAELSGLPLDRVLAATHPAFDPVEQAMVQATAARFRAHAIDRFGVPHGVLVRVEPVGEAGHDGVHQALVYLDPAEAELERLREAAAQWREDEQQVRRQATHLSRLQQEITAFGTLLSHDLRAPLRSIDGFAQILADDHADQLDRYGREHLNRIRVAGARMDRMFEAIQSLSELTGRSFSPIPVDLSALAREVAAELQQARADGLTPIQVADDVTVRGDPTLLRMLLEHLLGNALKFTGRRAEPLIEVGAVDDLDDRRIYFVRDNGEGFDMRFAERMFGLFQRLHSAEEFPGIGVGLAASRRIVRRHGGELWARGKPGAGACFYFTLWD
ncbi:MAG: ATP-binding protein [Lautropia sp.]